MNKAYNYKSDFNSYESNCNIIRIERREAPTSALDALGSFLGKIFSKNGIAFIRAIIATLCFFGFIGVIGGVEAETLSLGAGIVISLFLIFIEIICFSQKNRSK